MTLEPAGQSEADPLGADILGGGGGPGPVPEDRGIDVLVVEGEIEQEAVRDLIAQAGDQGAKEKVARSALDQDLTVREVGAVGVIHVIENVQRRDGSPKEQAASQDPLLHAHLQ